MLSLKRLFPLCVLAFGLGLTLPPAQANLSLQLGVFLETLQVVDTRSIQAPGEARLMEGAIRGLLASLEDPYSSYLTPAEYQQLSAEQGGAYVGLGIEVGMQERQLTASLAVPGRAPLLVARLSPWTRPPISARDRASAARGLASTSPESPRALAAAAAAAFGATPPTVGTVTEDDDEDEAVVLERVRSPLGASHGSHLVRRRVPRSCLVRYTVPLRTASRLRGPDVLRRVQDALGEPAAHAGPWERLWRGAELQWSKDTHPAHRDDGIFSKAGTTETTSSPTPSLAASRAPTRSAHARRLFTSAKPVPDSH
jgi:hypothetical protein